MFIDKLLQFSDAQDLGSASTGVNAATNTVDLLRAGENIGNGTQLYLVIIVDEAVTSAGAATVDFQLVTDTTETITPDTVIASSGAIGKADLTLNRDPIIIAVPPTADFDRYMTVNYEVGTAALTAGKFTAFLTTAFDQWKAYPDAI